MTLNDVSEETKVLDKIIGELGVGKFQIVSFFLISLTVSFILTCENTFIFTARDTPYRCLVPECEIEPFEYYSTWLSKALPFQNNIPKQCERFSVYNANLSDHNFEMNYRILNDTCNPDTFDDSNIKKCTDFVYGPEDSIVKEFNIACQDWKRSLVGSVNSAGQLVSFLFSGILSDKYGRKNVMVLLTLCEGVVGAIQSFSQNYWMFVGLEFLNLSLCSGAHAIAYVMAVESLPPNRRLFGCAILEVVCALSIASVGLYAWLVNSWRWLLRIANLPAFFMIVTFFILPESIRWLNAKGKRKECVLILERAAKMNGISFSHESCMELNTMSSESLQSVEEKQNNLDLQTSFFSIFKSSCLVKRLIVCAYCWFASVLTYSGLTINSVNISGKDASVYLDYVIVSLVELPSIVAYFIILHFIGRKVGLFVSFLGSGILCITYALVKINNVYLDMIIYLLGKFFITITYVLLHIYTTEVFPTSMRNSAMSFCMVIGRIGGLISPQVLLLEKIHESIPMLVFGIVPLLSVLIIFKLPETKNKKLPDSVTEAEYLG